MDLYDVDGDPVWLQHGRTLADLMIKRFRDNAQGGFFMSDAENALFANPKSLNDGSLPSGNSVAIMALASLALRTGDLSYQDHANEALQAISPSAGENIFSSTSLSKALDILVHGETGRYQYGARGAVKASAEIKTIMGDRSIEIKLQLADNWHINARQSNVNQTMTEDIIPTTIHVDPDYSAAQLYKIIYPDSINKRFSFIETPLQVYEGDVSILGSLNVDDSTRMNNIIPVIIRFQACNDQVCLAPEELTLRASM
jgi:hypothetical protein